MVKRIVIVAAKRTPQGRLGGSLAKLSAVELAVRAGREATKVADPGDVDLVILGNVLAAGQGMNIARQVAVGVGLPIEVPAYTVNIMCASGMHAVCLAAQTIVAGEARVVLCGGTESMSNAPYLLDRARKGYRFGDGTLIDCIMRDGLVDTFSNKHMALTAERLARDYDISRDEQDAFALRSHQRTCAAHEAGAFADEMITMEELDRDEHARAGTSLAKLGTLKPVFNREGTITAGNASGINDGAAMLLVCDEESALEHGWTPLAVVRGWASVGCDPELMGLGPVHATRRLCERYGCDVADFDTIEINEAFAAQTLACLKEFKIEADDRLNPEGGAIAMGHPVGTSGARLLLHLAHRIRQGKTRNALATLCVGGGMGMAVWLTAG